MPDFGVTPRKAEDLRLRMRALGIEETDLEEQFVRGGGPGGQKINKTAIAVQLRHVPTGKQVTAREARSQALNRYYARRRLCELLEAEALGAQSPEARRAEKVRKQKARRRRRARPPEAPPPTDTE